MPAAFLPTTTRWLLVLLLLALPAQFVWAAAARYCAHERSPTSFHLGHHAHEHRVAAPEAAHDAAHDGAPGAAQAAGDTQSGAESNALSHSDCSYCHGVVAQVAAQGPPLGAAPVPHSGIPAATAFLDGGLQASIERPKWTRAR